MSVEGPFSKWFAWGNTAVTVGMATLLMGMWNSWRASEAEAARERIALEARIVMLEQQERSNERTAANILMGVSAEINGLIRSTDVQRADIRAMQVTLDQLARGYRSNSGGYNDPRIKDHGQ